MGSHMKHLFQMWVLETVLESYPCVTNGESTLHYLYFRELSFHDFENLMVPVGEREGRAEPLQIQEMSEFVDSTPYFLRRNFLRDSRAEFEREYHAITGKSLTTRDANGKFSVDTTAAAFAMMECYGLFLNGHLN